MARKAKAKRAAVAGDAAGLKHTRNMGLLGVVAIIALVALALLYLGRSSAATGGTSISGMSQITGMAHYSRPYASPYRGWIGPYTPGTVSTQAACVNACNEYYYYGSAEHRDCWAVCKRGQEDIGRYGGIRPWQNIPPDQFVSQRSPYVEVYEYRESPYYS